MRLSRPRSLFGGLALAAFRCNGPAFGDALGQPAARLLDETLAIGRLLELLLRIGDRLLQALDDPRMLRMLGQERHTVHRAEGLGLAAPGKQLLRVGVALRLRRCFVAPTRRLISDL